jgi:agmatine deiminase
MIADWEINGVFLADLFKDRYPDLFKQLHSTLISHSVEVGILQDVCDICARDYCPIQVGPQKFVKFRYTPDYLILSPELHPDGKVVTSYQGLGDFLHPPIALPGGNIVASQTKAILTDKIYEDNPDWTHADLRKELKRILQVEQIIVVPQEPYELFGHADSMVRFIDERTVVMNDYSEVDPAFGKRQARTLRSYDLVIELIPYSAVKWLKDGIPCFKDGLPSAQGCYVNYLRTEQVVLFPVFGAEQDQIALNKLKSLIPDVPIVPLDCSNLARESELLNSVGASFRRPRETQA